MQVLAIAQDKVNASIHKFVTCFYGRLPCEKSIFLFFFHLVGSQLPCEVHFYFLVILLLHYHRPIQLLGLMMFMFNLFHYHHIQLFNCWIIHVVCYVVQMVQIVPIWTIQKLFHLFSHVVCSNCLIPILHRQSKKMEAMAPCGMPRPCPWRALRPRWWPQWSQRPPWQCRGGRKIHGSWDLNRRGLVWRIISDFYECMNCIRLLMNWNYEVTITWWENGPNTLRMRRLTSTNRSYNQLQMWGLGRSFKAFWAHFGLLSRPQFTSGAQFSETLWLVGGFNPSPIY